MDSKTLFIDGRNSTAQKTFCKLSDVPQFIADSALPSSIVEAFGTNDDDEREKFMQSILIQKLSWQISLAKSV